MSFEASSKPKHAFKRLLPTDYFGIQNFMVSEGGMGLSGSNLMVFALVYSYSHNHDASDYYGSADFAAARLGLSRASVQAAFKSLLEQQLIYVKGERKSKKGKSMKVYCVAEDAVDRAIAEFEAYWSSDGIAYQPGYTRAGAAPKTSRPQDVVVENPASDNVQKLDIIENQQENGLDNVQKLDIIPNDNVQKLDIITKGLDLKGFKNKTNQPVEPPSGSDTAEEQDHKTEKEQVGRFNPSETKTQPIDPLGPEIQSAFDTLVEKTRNRNRIKYAPAAYAALVGEGYLPAEIARAWGARCYDAVSNDWQDSYHPQLAAFLEAPASDPAGARARIDRHRAKLESSVPARRPPLPREAGAVSPLEVLASVDGAFAALNDRARQAVRNHAMARVLRMSAAAQEAADKEHGDALAARRSYLSDLAAAGGLAGELARKCLAALDADGREVRADA